MNLLASLLIPFLISYCSASTAQAEEKILYQGRWIRMKAIPYVAPDGQQKSYEMVERTTRAKSSDCDAVVVTAILNGSQYDGPQLVLVKQHRPPVNGYTLEMPAGLVDAGESVAAAGLRELQEETGFVGTVTKGPHPICVSDGGMTNANLRMVEVTIDGDLPENVTRQPSLERIETVIVPLSSLKDTLDEYIAAGVHVDSRTYHFATGFELAKSLGHF